jgi:hypothetical protein
MAYSAKVARHSSCSRQGLHPQSDWEAVTDVSDDVNEVLATAEIDERLTDEGS